MCVCGGGGYVVHVGVSLTGCSDLLELTDKDSSEWNLSGDELDYPSENEGITVEPHHHPNSTIIPIASLCVSQDSHVLSQCC